MLHRLHSGGLYRFLRKVIQMEKEKDLIASEKKQKKPKKPDKKEVIGGYTRAEYEAALRELDPEEKDFFDRSDYTETKSTVTPLSNIDLTFSSLFLRNFASPTERTSSSISTSGSTAVAIEKPRRARIPEE